jgi:tetratricopeptide (TPR) repeat protein
VLSPIYSNYANVLLSLHAFDKAKLVATKALVVDRRNGSTAVQIAFDLGRLGLAIHAPRDDREAGRHLAEALETLREYTGEDSADVGIFELALGQIRHRQKDSRAAAGDFAIAVEPLQSKWEPGSQVLRGLRAWQAQALRRAREFAEAAKVDAPAMRIEVRATLQNQ